MKRDVIFHNPRCSKSRATLTILKEHDVDIEVCDYLKTPPSSKELKLICAILGVSPTAIIRTRESVFKTLGLSKHEDRSHAQWFEIIHDHPILLERPIVVYRQRVVIGRPPENVLEILDAG